MNQATINANVQDESISISVTKADVRVFSKVIEVWHILDTNVFSAMIMKFNRDNPRLQDSPEVKEKIIKFLNKQFRMRVAFKSKEAFTKQFAKQTYKAVKQRIEANGNKTGNRS